MLQSMTGFGSMEREIRPFGKVYVELKSANHKFFETVFHLPEKFLFLEERIRKEIESRIKRGRVVCVVNITGAKGSTVSLNKALLKNYIVTLEGVKRQFKIRDGIDVNTLIHLPGVLSLEENITSRTNIWPPLKVLVNRALEDLLKTRQKEGEALAVFLKKRGEFLKESLGIVGVRFKKALKKKLDKIETDEERSGFLKATDISEELERLVFHIRNFKSKLSAAGPVGKELDFIAQEMQRETNTLAAKLFDAAISSRVVQMKSQIEKIREQVQNIE